MREPSIEILFASPRRNGKTGLILSALNEAFATMNITPSVDFIYEINIIPCIECEICYDGSPCPLDDDMREIYPKLEQCDGLVFLTPIFFASFPAKAKAIIDRAQPYYIRKYVLKNFVRKTGVGTVIAHSERDKNFGSLEHTAKYFFDSLGLEFFTPLYLPRFDAQNEDWKISLLRFVDDFVKKLKEVEIAYR